MIKDIVKHFVLITYIQKYLSVKVNEIFNNVNNDTTETNYPSTIGKNQIIEDSSFSEVEMTDGSPSSRFVNTLSPIKYVEASHPTHGFLELNTVALSKVVEIVLLLPNMILKILESQMLQPSNYRMEFHIWKAWMSKQKGL